MQRHGACEWGLLADVNFGLDAWINTTGPAILPLPPPMISHVRVCLLANYLVPPADAPLERFLLVAVGTPGFAPSPDMLAVSALLSSTGRTDVVHGGSLLSRRLSFSSPSFPLSIAPSCPHIELRLDSDVVLI